MCTTEPLCFCLPFRCCWFCLGAIWAAAVPCDCERHCSIQPDPLFGAAIDVVGRQLRRVSPVTAETIHKKTYTGTSRAQINGELVGILSNAHLKLYDAVINQRSICELRDNSVSSYDSSLSELWEFYLPVGCLSLQDDVCLFKMTALRDQIVVNTSM